ncbi:hypothetical protein [Bordetella trematum]|uniref:hypothetical protein n=1 Tax=Bordetella trematum TaxID=123899 RepID=UPI0015C5291B|nr:hypothetical protein [Bordetella trematum]
MTPNTSSATDPIAEAIQLLTEEAAGLRDCHTLAPGVWTGEPEAKAHYDRTMAVVARLEKLHQNDSYMNHKSAFCLIYKPPK